MGKPRKRLDGESAKIKGLHLIMVQPLSFASNAALDRFLCY